MPACAAGYRGIFRHRWRDEHDRYIAADLRDGYRRGLKNRYADMSFARTLGIDPGDDSWCRS